MPPATARNRVPGEWIGIKKSGLRIVRPPAFLNSAEIQPNKREVLTAAGLILAISEYCSPIRQQFADGPEGEADYEAHLDALSARHCSAIAKLKQQARATRSQQLTVRKLDVVVPLKEHHIVSPGRAYGSLRLIACGGCRQDLLVEADEDVRRQCRRRDILKRLPQPIAGRIDGRPYCLTCLPGAQTWESHDCRTDLTCLAVPVCGRNLTAPPPPQRR